MSKSLLNRQSGRLFAPKFLRGSKESSNYLAAQFRNSQTEDFFKTTNIESSSSFRYGSDSIVSTQQLRIDYSKYENHTFFHSAVAKVNEAYDNIVNFYPFEKSRKEIEKYEDDLTGFEKYVLDSFPKNVGYLIFSGTAPGESFSNGTQITVRDRSGASISEISDTPTGDPVLDPRRSPFSVEMFINLPTQANSNQIVMQKFAAYSNNMTISLLQDSSSDTCKIQFSIASGSAYSFVTGSITKGEFTHVNFSYDPSGDRKTKILINDSLHESNDQTLFKDLNYFSEDLTIGTGQDYRVSATSTFTMGQTFSGSIDDFRIFHNVFDKATIQKRKLRTYYPNQLNDNLKLFFRFNEPHGDYEGNNILIDASGNSLHSVIDNFELGCRSLPSDTTPVIFENLERNPILFPTHPDVLTLNTNLLMTAALYDEYNPNLITKLVPKHYFQEATLFRDYSEELDRLDNTFGSFSASNIGQNRSEIPAIQLLMKLLLSYGKFFDELKLYIDAVTSYRFTSYDDYDTTPDPLLIKKAKLLNVNLPKLFSGGDIEQVLEGVNLTETGGLSAVSLNQIQNLIWRRIISEAPKINQAKGTIRSIKSIFRNAGIEPDNIFSIREYGGSKEKSLDASKELKKDVYSFVNFQNSYGITVTSEDSNGYPNDSGIPRLKSGFLSGSRNQVGSPLISGTYVNKTDDNPHGESNNPSDGLYTSGSFTYEGLYCWQNEYNGIPQSLARMHVTGTLSPSDKEGCVLNVVATDNDINMYIREDATFGTSTDLKTVSIPNVNIFDGDVWYVSFGKKNAHDLNTVNTGSYFLRASKQNNGEIILRYEKESLFSEPDNSVFKNISEYNTSGSFILIGSQSIQPQASGYDLFLNDTNIDASTRATSFHGMITNARFFSKQTTKEEFLSRSKNYDSHGVENPFKNYNFTNLTTGSYERLLIQTDTKQNTINSDALGNFRLFDFTTNELHFEGSNFEPETTVVKNVRVNFEVLSDKFDLNQTKEKVRIRSFEDPENLDQSYFATIGPQFEVLPSEENVDDNRFSIDMSVMKGLNDNILRIFSDYSSLETSIGRPNNMFEDSYHDLKSLREIYFNNVLEELDLSRYREMFKWIDNAFTDSIYSILPRTTNFLGINFIYESHVLERNRFRYLSDDIYLLSNERKDNRGEFLLSQFVGRLKRH